MQAKKVVLCAGSWTNEMLKKMGVEEMDLQVREQLDCIAVFTCCLQVCLAKLSASVPVLFVLVGLIHLVGLKE